jgi:predicted Zn-dependent protease
MIKNDNEFEELFGMTRRRFLWMSALTAAGLAAGCAIDPVTGKNEFNMMSEQEEIQIDRQYSPLQFSADYGKCQDRNLNAYMSQVGRKLVPQTHRPRMPYNFQVVNAAYVNAYAFPGGTVVATRGILLKLNNEAELAGLIGHELGHVNARHTAEQMSKAQLTSLLLGVGTAIISTKSSGYGDIAGQLGQLGAGLLLASYSRDNEREADDLGNQYMVKAGYGTQGFVGLMQMLNTLSKENPGHSSVLFSTHPMSDERYQTAVENARTRYVNTKNLPLNREQYMDNTAGLRKIQGVVEALQKGDTAMNKKNLPEAESYFQQAIRQAPQDYAALTMMSKCLLAKEDFAGAKRYAKEARQAYPGEAQAYLVGGFAKMQLNEFDDAYQDFTACDKALPGSNPNITFYKGYCREQMGRKSDAAREYQSYLKSVQQGEYAQHAYKRLNEWGYTRSK